MHVHVMSADGEAKFWLEPEIALAKNIGFAQHHLRQIQQLVEVHRDEITAAWNRHFRDRSD
jgi:hypothetical protein